MQPPTVGVSESPGEPSRLAASGESQPPASAPSSQDGIRAGGTQGSTQSDSLTVITPLDPVKVAFKLENSKHFRYLTYALSKYLQQVAARDYVLCHRL